jgi:hypothetical protein
MPNNIQFHFDFFSVSMKVHEQNMIFGLEKFRISMHFAKAGRMSQLDCAPSHRRQIRDAIHRCIVIVLDDMAF